MDPISQAPANDPVIPSLPGVSQLLCLLAVAMLAFSISINSYLYKQNRMLDAQRTQQKEQIQRVQQTETALNQMLQELANQSVQHPEIRTLLAKYGITISVAPQR